ncbi:MAG: ATP-binding cassette domain-containing protein [Tenericutes bacterium]|nr:ATP-binding cassette domain-containing protein [Mycoplasmatota bacterium]
MIKIKQLSKTFGMKHNPTKVLKDVTVDFPEKGLVVILGHSGSGKTTLLNIMGGLERPTQGEVIIDEKILKNKSEKDFDFLRNQEIGYIFQNYNLIPNLTVYENVALSLRIKGYQDEAEIEQRVFYTLKAVNMFYFRGRLVTQLSGGQQQRVAIARALVKNPKFILADEPTGNLDSKNTFEIMNIIKKIAEEKLVILVSHEKDLVSHYADRIIEIKDGFITNDYINQKSAQYVVDDNTIYIKDLEEDINIKEKSWDLSIYSDEKEKNHNYKVSLILRNGTLYLNTQGPIKNIKVVNNESNITIDETKKKADVIEEVQYSDFDLKALEDEKDHKQYKSFMTYKKAFGDALHKLFAMQKRTRLMFFVFILMGLVISIGVPFINNVLQDRAIYLSDQPNYVRINSFAPSTTNYRFLQSLENIDDDDFFINVYPTTNIRFNVYSMRGFVDNFIYADIGIHDHLRHNELIYGKMPENQYELAIDYSLIREDYTNPTSLLKAVGVWDYKQIIGREIVNIYMPNKPFIITGIVDTGAKRFYAAKESMPFLASNNGIPYLPSEMFIGDENFILNGKMPAPFDPIASEHEVIVPISYIDLDPTLATFDFSAGRYQIDFNIYATGMYEYTDGNNFDHLMLAHHGDVSYRIFQYAISQRTTYIYTNNPQKIMLALEDNYRNIQVESPYMEAMKEGKVFLMGLQSFVALGVLLIILSVACIYFMLKSSMTANIYEISVYRALGVKKRDITKRFVAETFVILTFSSTICYAIGTYVLAKIDLAVLLQANYFLVTPMSIISGLLIIYFIGMVGVIPIYRLLKKSPAQILSYYDI